MRGLMVLRNCPLSLLYPRTRNFKSWLSYAKPRRTVLQTTVCAYQEVDKGRRYYSRSVSSSANEEELRTVMPDKPYPKLSIKYVMNNCSPGQHVRIQGWVRSYRRLKENCFIEVSDGSSEHRLSVTSHNSKIPKGLAMHTSVDVSGQLFRHPNNPQILELKPSDVKLVSNCDQRGYPFGGKIKYTQDYIRQYIHMRPKTNTFSSMLRLRSEMCRAIAEYFSSNGFFQIHVPILTSNDCEGAGETFIVKPESEDLIQTMKKSVKVEEKANLPSDDEVFFDKKVHLSVSGQLHLESATSGLNKVWTCSPVFRAENSQTTRHLSEFYMVEAELAFAYEIEQILEVMEGLVKFCIKKLLSDCIGDWSMQAKSNETDIRKVLDHIISRPFTVMTFEEASNLLRDKESSVVIPSKGLSREQELILVEKLNDNIPIFVIDWPKDIKPFYMRECAYDSNKVSAVDLLVPIVGELCGGSLREADASKLESRINQMDPSEKLGESLSWYIDLRRFGGSPTGGFGLGFDRLMQLVTGVENIKDVSPFPRWPHHCSM